MKDMSNLNIITMISTFAIECINGALKKVQTITYRGGRTVRRIFAPSSVVPEEVQVIAERTGQTVEHRPIEHPEAVLYRHHFGL